MSISKLDNWQIVTIQDRLRRFGLGYKRGTCEHCGKAGLRYVHIIEGGNPRKKLRLGACCAARFVSGYKANQAQAKLANVLSSLMGIPSRKSWSQSGNGNQTIVINGWRLTVFPDKQAPGWFTACLSHGPDERYYPPRKYATVLDAKIDGAIEYGYRAGLISELESE